MNILNLSSKKKLIDGKFKDGICTELCFKLWFESNWYFFKVIVQSPIAQVFPIKWLSTRVKIGVILEITYTWMESYPLSNKHKQLIKILSSCLRKLRGFFLKYDFRNTCPTILNNYFQKKPPEVFFKKVTLKNFGNIHLETHVFWLSF